MVKKNLKNHFYNYILAKKDTKKKESGKKEKKGKLGLRIQTFFFGKSTSEFCNFVAIISLWKEEKQTTYL